MSDLVEKRLVGLLDHPHHDPYGNPIPGLSELGEEYTDVPFLTGVISLPSAFEAAAKKGVKGEPLAASLTRIAEPLQTDIELLARLSEAGLVPGSRITAEHSGGTYTVAVDGAGTALELGEDVARHLFVATA